MKSFISIWLLTLFLLAGSRMAVNLHYCGGRLASVEFFAKKEVCGKCGMKKNTPCCQDQTKVFSSEDHSVTSFQFSFTHHFFTLPATTFTLQWQSVPTSILREDRHWANAPPYPVLLSRYLLFHSLIV